MQFFLAQAANEPSGGMAGWALDLIDSLGAMGLALLSALDSMTSILPVDLLLPLVGYSATQGSILIGTAILCSTAGSIAGYLALYTVGARLGRERSRAVLTRIPGIKAESVDRAEAWFARHGAQAVLFGRVLPGFRCFVSIPAGVERMPLRKYLLLSGLGGLLWNSTLLLSGYLLGENWHRISDLVGMLPYVLIVAVVLGVPLLLVRRSRRKRNAAADVDGVTILPVSSLVSVSAAPQASSVPVVSSAPSDLAGPSPLSASPSAGRRSRWKRKAGLPDVSSGGSESRRWRHRKKKAAGEPDVVSSGSPVRSDEPGRRSRRKGKATGEDAPSDPSVPSGSGPGGRRKGRTVAVPSVLKRRGRLKGRAGATGDDNGHIEEAQP